MGIQVLGWGGGGHALNTFNWKETKLAKKTHFLGFGPWLE